MKELNKTNTYTFFGKIGLWVLCICVSGHSQNFMMTENLDSHGFLILELQDTSVGNWESGQYIVYQDNMGEIYTHPLADKYAAGFSPPSSEKYNSATAQGPESEINPWSSKSVIQEANKDMNPPQNRDVVPENEGAKKKGRRQKVQKVVPE